MDKGMINDLVAATNSMGGTSSITFEREDGITVEIASYPKGIRPARKVLDDLYDWAEESGLDNIVEKIIELEEL